MIKFSILTIICQVKLSEKLSHVQSLCVHEMIVRAFKHIVRAVIAAVTDIKDLAVPIAATLNLLLGFPDSGVSHSSVPVHTLVWRWLEVFLRKRYDWELTVSNYHDIRKYAILRGVCHKVMALSFENLYITLIFSSPHMCIFLRSVLNLFPETLIWIQLIPLTNWISSALYLCTR